MHHEIKHPDAYEKILQDNLKRYKNTKMWQLLIAICFTLSSISFVIIAMVLKNPNILIGIPFQLAAAVLGTVNYINISKNIKQFKLDHNMT